MYWFAPDAANWLVARLIDSATAGRAQLPARALEFGILIIVAAFAALAWLGWQWLRHRREERDQPPPGNLLDVQDWLADRTEEIPAPPGPRYRGRRRAPREPRKPRPRQHVVPAHPLRADVVAAQVIGGVSADPDATAVLVRTRGRWGAQ